MRRGSEKTEKYRDPKIAPGAANNRSREGHPMTPKIVYTSRFVRVILAQRRSEILCGRCKLIGSNAKRIQKNKKISRSQNRSRGGKRQIARWAPVSGRRPAGRRRRRGAGAWMSFLSRFDPNLRWNSQSKTGRIYIYIYC